MDIVNLVVLLSALWGVMCFVILALAVYLFIFDREWLRGQLARFVGDEEQLEYEYERRWSVFRKELEQLRSEKSQHTTQVDYLTRQYTQDKQKQEAVSKELFGYIGQIAPALDMALGNLPEVPSIDKYFGKMSKKMKDELTIPLAPVFAQGAVMLTAQQIAAVSKLQEISQRLVLYLHVVKMEGQVLPTGLDAELAINHELYQIFKKWDAKIDDPAFQMVTDELVAKAVSKLMNESKLAEGAINPTAVTKIFLATREERKRRLAEEKKTSVVDTGAKEEFDNALKEVFGDFGVSEPVLNSMSKNGNGKGKHQ